MKSLSPEQRLKLMVECRRAERILKHFWLKRRVVEVRGFLAGLELELAALEGELDERRSPGRRAGFVEREAAG